MSDEQRLIEEARAEAYLISRGVRPVAMIEWATSADPVEMRSAHQMLLEACSCWENVVPFVFPVEGEAYARTGFAAHPYLVEFFEWAEANAPPRWLSVIHGLLFGYSLSKIGEHDDQFSHRFSCEFLDELIASSESRSR